MTKTRKKEEELRQQTAKLQQMLKEGPANRMFRDIFWKYFGKIEELKLQIVGLQIQEARLQADQKTTSALEATDADGKPLDEKKRLQFGQEKELRLREIKLALSENKNKTQQTLVQLAVFEEEVLKFLSEEGSTWTVQQVLGKTATWGAEVHEKYEKSKGEANEPASNP